MDNLKQKNILFCITSITTTDLSVYVLKVIMRFQERQDKSIGRLQNFATVGEIKVQFQVLKFAVFSKMWFGKKSKFL